MSKKKSLRCKDCRREAAQLKAARCKVCHEVWVAKEICRKSGFQR